MLSDLVTELCANGWFKDGQHNIEGKGVWASDGYVMLHFCTQLCVDDFRFHLLDNTLGPCTGDHSKRSER